MTKLSMMLVAMMAWTAALMTPSSATAQPEGNSHPQSVMLSQAGSVNPFGEPSTQSVHVDEKWAFAQKVDITQLRNLAVFHNGRVKILDTLARETVGDITGRKDYIDFRPSKTGGGGEKLKYDPLFTFLDVVIDPSYYEMRPIISVDYLPAREAFLEFIYNDKQMATVLSTAEMRESYRKIGRIPPALVARYYSKVSSANMTDVFQKALSKVHESVMLYSLGARNFLMVPPDSVDKPWQHLSTLDPASPTAAAVKTMGSAWRAGDAAAVNIAIKTLASSIPAIQPTIYPTTKRTMEAAYNAANPFEWGFWFYALALITLLMAFAVQRPWLKWTGISFLTLAAGMHLFGFATRCYIAERFAIQNQFESMTGVSLFAAIVGLGLAIFTRQLIYGAAVAAVGFLVLITATKTGIPGYSIGREAAILNTSVLLKYHVTIVLLSYGLISLGFVISLFHLAMHYLTKRSAARSQVATVAMPGGGSMQVNVTDGGEVDSVMASALGGGAGTMGRARVLADLDSALMTVLQMAFWTLGVGILLGAWWADHSWGRWWAFDPKELWALLTWLVYLVVVHLRFSSIKSKGLVTAWLSVLGFIVMLWCYFGVNLLLPGLHAYA